MTDLDNLTDRNLAAALWATNQEMRFEDFGDLAEIHQEYWLYDAKRFRELLAVILKPADILTFPGAPS